MILIADDTGSREFLKSFPKGEAQLMPHSQMPFGDFAWTGKGPGERTVWIGVEFKTLGDVLDCIDTGRFAGHQLLGMLDTYDYPFLMVEGMWRARRGDGVLMMPKGNSGQWGIVKGRQEKPYTFTSLSSWLMSMTLRGGITLMPMSPRRTDSVQLIRGLYKSWQRPWKQHRAHLAQDTSHRPTLYRPTICQSIAACLPGIGWGKAAQISDHFKHDPARMVRATEEEWLIPKVVGKATAVKLRRIFNEGQERKDQERDVARSAD